MARHDDDDAFDERGLLRDGRRARVPLMMRDSDGLSDLQRSVMADSMQRDAAKRFGLNDSLALHKPGQRFCTDEAARDAVEQARREWIDEMTTAWQRKPTEDLSGEFRGAQEGDVCTVREGGIDEGSPGHLRMVNGKLTCVPDKRSQDSGPPRSMSVDAAQVLRDAAYEESVRAELEAWKGPAR
jgi:hypothetical protein